jgi:hypothetical protein
MKIKMFSASAVFLINALWMMLAGCASQQSYNEGSSRLGYVKKTASSSIGMFIAPSALAGTDVIKPDQAFSIRLLSAYICDFRESESWQDFITKSNKGVKLPCAGGDGSQNAQTRGEIAIVANVGERKDTAGLTFDPNDIKKSGHVIYYNEDVRETGQLINAMNLPVYGPKTYKGDSFFMDWSILELDTEESGAARATIKRLAELGGVAYPPGVPVLNVLNSIGSAMLANNGDDIEMRYQMEFDPYLKCQGQGCSSSSGVYRAVLRQGYYALLRSEQRDVSPPLETLGVCEDSGMLCENGQPYRKASWLLLRVSLEDAARAQKQDDTATLASLLESLNKSDNPAAMTDVKNAVQAVLKK